MTKYAITADIDVTIYLGVLEDFQYAPMDIEYENLASIFERGGIYIPTRNELENQLLKLSMNIEKDFMAYLRESADERLFEISDLTVWLPLSSEAFIASFGRTSTFVNGVFEAVVKTNASKDDVYDAVSGALNMAIGDAYIGVDNLDALNAVCLDVSKIGE